jgi:hypothetical protein
MKVSELKEGYHMFGNKGNVWNNTAHIAKSGFNSSTLCETPMLSRNWAKIEELQEIGCPECLEIYKKLKNESTSTIS